MNIGASGPTDPTLWPTLMSAAQDGDQEAYRQVLKAMIPAIRSLARRRISDDALVEDVVQEVLLTVHRVRHTYDPRRPILPWLGAIVSARAVDALRRRGRAWRREVFDEAAMAQAADPGAGRTAEALAAGQEIDRLLAALTPSQRMAMEMVRLRGMSLDDASRESRLSTSAIKTLLHRAVARMRKMETGIHG